MNKPIKAKASFKNAKIYGMITDPITGNFYAGAVEVPAVVIDYENLVLQSGDTFSITIELQSWETE